jgi:hypothetical protein
VIGSSCDLAFYYGLFNSNEDFADADNKMGAEDDFAGILAAFFIALLV